MGNGIAHVFAQHDFEVHLVDVSEQQLGESYSGNQQKPGQASRQRDYTERKERRDLVQHYNNNFNTGRSKKCEIGCRGGHRKCRAKTKNIQGDR